RRLFHEMISTIIGVALVNTVACAGPEGVPPEIEELTRQLTSEYSKVGEEARRNLETMGAEVVPKLFDKLLVADWTLKPRLLEVLSAHGREFAKQKLLKGNETEKSYAALLYELTRAGEPNDYDTAEFKAMVDALLKAIKSDDKYLRAAAIDALLHDTEKGVVFEHYRDLVPAMISSFDVDLVIKRRTRAGGFVTLWNICMALESLGGDRLAFFESEKAMQARAKGKRIPAGASDTAQVRVFIDANGQHLDVLRQDLASWWTKHSTQSVVEIGKLMIERNLSILEREPFPDTERARVVIGSLETWTGNVKPRSFEEWRAWWRENQDSYAGPLTRSED
ncbi:MAG: hypothetical protein AAB341_01380, partial [Planctomycetota bacterium]